MDTQLFSKNNYILDYLYFKKCNQIVKIILKSDNKLKNNYSDNINIKNQK